MLRALGFEINWLGREGVSLIAEPPKDAMCTLREQLTLQRFQDKLPVLSCMVCGEEYQTSPMYLASYCSVKCGNKINGSARDRSKKNRKAASK